MKVLALSDKVLKTVYTSQITQRYGDVDMVIGCGDLPYYYLEFVVTMLNVPVYYVHGNHDRVEHRAGGRIVDRAEGCCQMDGQVRRAGNVLLAGLGGSMRYQPGASNQYTNEEMTARILRMVPRLLLNKLAYGRYLDVLVTHSPPFGIHDGPDLPHTGFKSFLTFMRYFQPAYLLHGHKHIYRRGEDFITQYWKTIVVNVYPHRMLYWDWNG